MMLDHPHSISRRCALVLTVVALALASSARAGAEPESTQQVPPTPEVAPPSTEAPTEAAPPSTEAVAPLVTPSAPVSETPAPLYTFRPDEVCPFCVLTPQFPEGRSGLHWHQHWRAVGTTEYIVAPTLLAASLTLAFTTPSPKRARWSGPILFDGVMRDWLRLSSPAGREEAARVSDAIFYLEVLHPTVIDPLITAWWVRKSPRVAWQMFVINAQAYGLTILINDVFKRLTARARPWVSEGICGREPSAPGCNTKGGNRSFYSGHAAITATGAGLICAHHTQLSLYQDPVFDVGTCGLAVLGTAVTGAMRISSDNHWASDVLAGHLMGYISGYLLPTLLYYREFSASPHEHTEPAGPIMAALPLPMLEPGVLGLSLYGLW